VEGAADLAYAVPNLYVDLHSPRPGVPVLWWRSVGHSHTAFVVESFIDELAHAAGKDPFEYRRGLLAHHPRHKGVLELAAAKAGWGKPLPAGRGRGIAVHESFGSFVAQGGEVSIGRRGQVKVNRVVAAVDCGQYVNPDTIAAQIEGGVAFGLSAALHGQITLKGGRVVQSNFHDYEVLRLNEMPEVEVHILPSGEKPGGVGEPGVPPVAPAVANAIFALTGTRVRRLPIRPEDMRKAGGSARRQEVSMLNKTTDAQTSQGVPIGMTQQVVDYFKSRSIRVMLSIGGITYVDAWNQALAANATQLGLNAAEVAQRMGVGIEIDYEANTNANLAGLQAFIDAYRSVLPYDPSGSNPAARLTIDLAAGDRWLIDLTRKATGDWLDAASP